MTQDDPPLTNRHTTTAVDEPARCSLNVQELFQLVFSDTFHPLSLITKFLLAYKNDGVADEAEMLNVLPKIFTAI